MSDWTRLEFGWAWLACFGLSFVSAVVPWIAAEIIVLAIPAVARSPGALLLLVASATLGQMSGKVIVYWVGRGSVRWSSPRITAALARWERTLTRGSSLGGVVFVSSALGWPPFFAVTAVAGAMRAHFPTFMIAGTMGRLVRFGALVFVPHAIRAWS